MKPRKPTAKQISRAAADLRELQRRARAYTRSRGVRKHEDGDDWWPNVDEAREYQTKAKLEPGGYVSLFLRTKDGEWLLEETRSRAAKRTRVDTATAGR